MNSYSSLSELFSERLTNYRKDLSARKPHELYEPCNYILGLGGKRLRPLLTLIACDMFEKKPDMALDSALAVELFHNFSLIHDDILDKAPLRRNKPTVHVKWNQDIAILSGDALLVEASRVLESYPASRYKALCSVFNKTATQVCEGQQTDMNFETRKKVDAGEYIQMINYKTAVLLGCSLKMGAICASAKSADQEKIYDFGRQLGIAFQLLDDYLDVFTPDKKSFGKQLGGDIISNKKTYLLIRTMELADNGQKKQLSALLNEKNAKLKVKKVSGLMKEIGADKDCLEQANNYTQMALQSLHQINASNSKKETLKQFAISLIKRQA